jgi:APA family basic amino acid/polyamine antiporter
MGNPLFAKKSIDRIMGASEGKTLKRTLGAGSLIALGIGAIIGAGLFVRTAAAAGEHAGPAVTISFLIAAIACAFAGLCYAEFASMIPVAGSAYTYAYATMGEIVAWIIGWALILEYALGAATVSIAWSEYLNNLLGGAIPYEWCHSPFESMKTAIGQSNIDQLLAINPKLGAGIKDGLMHITDDNYKLLPESALSLVHLTSGYINAPALLILILITFLLIKGTQESAVVNAIIVFVKVFIVLIFIFLGWKFINPDNLTPYIIPDNQPGYEDTFKHGWLGILRGAAVVFFAFIGFDAVSTAAQEAKNPKRDMPIGILGSLAICTILYILFAHVLTGVAPFTDFVGAGKEASVSYAIKTYMTEYSWLGNWINVAILAGFSSVILVMLMGQSRVFYSMSGDGLLPKVFSDLHPKFQTPYKSNIILLVFVGIFGGFIPGSVAGDLTSIGTLLAFVLVCAGVMIMRKTDPTRPRPFRAPLVPVIPALGILVCLAMIVSLDATTQITALAWMLFGLIIYFSYSRHRSKLKNNP